MNKNNDLPTQTIGGITDDELAAHAALGGPASPSVVDDPDFYAKAAINDLAKKIVEANGGAVTLAQAKKIAARRLAR